MARKPIALLILDIYFLPIPIFSRSQRQKGRYSIMNADLISQRLNNFSTDSVPAIQAASEFIFQNKAYHPVLTDTVTLGSIFSVEYKKSGWHRDG